MDDERSLLDEVLDRVFFAPVGIAVDFAKGLSGHTAGPRSRIMGVGRVVGEAGRSLGTNAVDRAVSFVREVSHDHIESTDAAAASPSVPPTALPFLAQIDNVRSLVLDRLRGAVPTSALPIADYDDLPTATIVAQLATLSAPERATIAAYEAAHRNRRTVLGRLRQLSDADGS